MAKPLGEKHRTLDVLKSIQRAFSLHQQGRLKDAEKLYQAILASHPNHFDALHLLGVLRAQQGQLEMSAELISRALDKQRNSAEAHFNLGLTLSRLNRHAEAIDNYDKALLINPHYTEVLHSRGDALAELGCHQDALAAYDKALSIKPDLADVLYVRGSVLQKLSRYAEALASYDKALAIKPTYPEAFNNRGNTLQSLKRLTEAVESYDNALAIKPALTNALYNRGNALARLNRHEEAIADFSKALEVNRDYPYAIGNLAHSLAHICDWSNFESIKKRIVREVRSGKTSSFPFTFLSISDSPSDQFVCASNYVRDRYPMVMPPLWAGEQYEHNRIRVAYLSADFRDHAVAYLMAGLFERHDKTRFEITAVSFRPDSRGVMQKRLKNAVERFIDVRQENDLEVAKLLRELEIDVAVDLMGFTTDCRPRIFAYRAAPIQVNYLGFPGTTGAEYIDYVLADRFVVPEDQYPYYSEKVVYLPDCFQVNDSKRRIARRTPTRAEVGLPEDGFVFCCFNNTYKLTPEVFDIWMRLLHQVDRSVLWLLQPRAVTATNLRREAQARGVNPERLVFAPRVKVEHYLARYRLADLFLDTLPYNAGTTASDALWAGLPVLTRAGNTFAARMAGSLLHAVRLPELVTHTAADYEALAVGLATDRTRLDGIKEKLASNRQTTPLFDTDCFRRHIEAAYTAMWEISQRGEPPRAFAV